MIISTVVWSVIFEGTFPSVCLVAVVQFRLPTWSFWCIFAVCQWPTVLIHVITWTQLCVSDTSRGHLHPTHLHGRSWMPSISIQLDGCVPVGHFSELYISAWPEPAGQNSWIFKLCLIITKLCLVIINHKMFIIFCV